jgi:hypothetical protein
LFDEDTEQAAAQGGRIAVWDTKTGAIVASLDHLQKLSQYATKVSLSRDGRRLLVFGVNGKDDWPTSIATLAADKLTIEVVNARALGLPTSQEPTALVLSSDGSRLLAGYDDGSVVLATIDGTAPAETIATHGQPIATLAMSDDNRWIVSSDRSNTVSVFDRTTHSTTRNLTLPAPVWKLLFLPGSPSMLIVDAGLRFEIVPLAPTVYGLEQIRDIADWARAVRLVALDADTSSRYQLDPPPRAHRPDLEALPLFPVPPVVHNGPVSAILAECDRLAANPFDRDQRAEGVALTDIDTARAEPVCAAALAEAPQDLTTAYQVARVAERLKGPEAAMPQYLALSAKGYAMAMRSVLRLIEADTSGQVAAVAGDAAIWRDRALKAGDLISLWSDATRLALQDASPGSLEAAFERLAAGGITNRISAARVLFLRARTTAKTGPEMSRVLFLGMLALHLEETDDDPQPLINPDDRLATRDAVRALCRTTPAQDVIAAYRAASAWTAQVR